MTPAAGGPDGSDGQRQRRVQVTVPEQYRPVADEVWDELEEYVYLGFLTSSSRLHGRTFVFKTLNQNEVRILQLMKPKGAAAPEVSDHYRATFIAHSVLLIDGENALVDRTRHIRRMVDLIKKLEPKIQDAVVEELSFLNEKAGRLHPLVEVYVHENRSRFRWMHIRGSHLSVHSPGSTGFEGTDRIGMNHAQQTWTALNELLDVQEDMDRSWHNAKFIGSCFAGKGVRAVDERDRARKQRERSEREDLKMKVLHDYLNRQVGRKEDHGDLAQLPDGRTAKVQKKFQAMSVQELADQLSAALSGEKDHHDLVVERQLQRIAQIRSENEEARQRIWRTPALRDGARGSVPLSGASRVIGGKAEAEAQLSRMRKLQLDMVRKQARQIPPDLQDSDEGGIGGPGEGARR